MDGERGFLVTGLTCQDALRGLKDLRLWLDVEAEVKPEAQGLDAELAELRCDPSERRFITVGMVCKQVRLPFGLLGAFRWPS